MATIFLTSPAAVAEHSDNGIVYCNSSMRISEKGQSIFEVKTSAISDGNPVLCITYITTQPQFSDIKDAKKKCEEAESAIKKTLEEEGFQVFQGVVSEANSQRFSTPIEDAIKDGELKVKPKNKKQKQEPIKT